MKDVQFREGSWEVFQVVLNNMKGFIYWDICDWESKEVSMKFSRIWTDFNCALTLLEFWMQNWLLWSMDWIALSLSFPRPRPLHRLHLAAPIDIFNKEFEECSYFWEEQNSAQWSECYFIFSSFFLRLSYSNCYLTRPPKNSFYKFFWT